MTATDVDKTSPAASAAQELMLLGPNPSAYLDLDLIISKANSYNGTWVDRFNRGTINVTDVFVLFGFAFLVYFAINFTLSCVVRRMRTRKRA